MKIKNTHKINLISNVVDHNYSTGIKLGIIYDFYKKYKNHIGIYKSTLDLYSYDGKIKSYIKYNKLMDILIKYFKKDLILNNKIISKFDNLIKKNYLNETINSEKIDLIKIKFLDELFIIDFTDSDIPDISKISLYFNKEISPKKLKKFNKIWKNVIKEILNESKNNIKIIINNINYLCFDNSELYTRSFDIEEENENIPFDLLYSQDINNFYNELTNSLLTNTKGIYILHGKPGTGKTTFIKKLIQDELLSDKTFVFVTYEMLINITNDKLLIFLNNNKDKEFVFICEDADKFLLKRNLGNNIASSILNLSDGILSSLTNIQFIFSHNTNNENLIDEAFLRNGRLIANKQFKSLEYNDWSKIIDYVDENKNIVIDSEENKVLADVFELIKLNKNINKKILKDNKKDKAKIEFKVKEKQN